MDDLQMLRLAQSKLSDLELSELWRRLTFVVALNGKTRKDMIAVVVSNTLPDDDDDLPR
jgi:hypothetical protein